MTNNIFVVQDEDLLLSQVMVNLIRLVADSGRVLYGRKYGSEIILGPSRVYVRYQQTNYV